MKTLIKTLIFSLLFVIFSSTVYAGCWYDGKEYSSGQRVGSKICGSDGYWR
ncbi:MAG: hypothetical protein GY702_24305 [Desulfobulbaceae bacterium]|nr:hypothetical protein [Desulfobulbaceae bacterium]